MQNKTKTVFPHKTKTVLLKYRSEFNEFLFKAQNYFGEALVNSCLKFDALFEAPDSFLYDFLLFKEKSLNRCEHVFNPL